MKTMFTSMKTLGALLLLFSAAVNAQDEGMSTTVGTTITDGGGQAWAYLVWQATAPEKLASSAFGIYAKTGNAASTNPFTKIGETSLDADPAVLGTHLANSVNLGADLPMLEENLDAMFEGLIANNSTLTLADKLSVTLQGAMQDTDLYNQMLFLGRAHPGVNMGLGLAWVEAINVLTTYEIRELDPLTGTDGRVLGRITLDPASGPVVLPAPGTLYQPVEAGGKGHLNVRLRWSTPDTLRRLDPLQHGFNVYRMSKSFATGNGYDSNPPTPATMAALVAGNPSDVVQVNIAPALSAGDYDNSNVADSSDDTAFIVDDNNQFFGGQPFEACTEYYYFVAARDILGRDGQISDGLHVTVCDRFPPGTPGGLAVGNDYQYTPGVNPVDGVGDQRLLVTWKQNDETSDSKRASAYYVYRWDTPTEYLAHANDPGYNLIAGPIPHLPGEETNSYRDDGTGAPSMPADASRTYWYTVRAVDDGDCNSCLANYSGNSAPAFGVLRDREGPAGPDGTIEIECARMDVRFIREYTEPYKNLGLPEADPNMGQIPDLRDKVQAQDDCDENTVTITQNPAPFTPVQPGTYPITITATDPSGNSANCQTTVDVYPGNAQDLVYILEAVRPDDGAAWAEFYLNGTDPVNLLARVNFALGSNIARYTYILPAGSSPNFSIYCRMGSSVGEISEYDIHSTSTTPNLNEAVVLSFEGRLSTVKTDSTACDGPHIAVLPNGTINPISGTIDTTATTRQWKLYRRVDEGDLTLLAVGEATHPSTVTWLDDSMPINATRICYFAQLFDEHGNGSPMVRLGCTRTTGSGGLPVPMLTELQAMGDETTPELKIRWFSEVESVDRFQIYISPSSGSLPDPFSDKLSEDQAPSPNMATAVLPGGDVDLDFRAFNSSRVGGPDFGATPIYEVTVPIVLGETYTVMIRTMDPTNGVGPLSNAKQFTWTPATVGPTPTGPDVPWPARPEPPVTKSGFERVIARQLLLETGFSGVGVRIGELDITGLNCLGGDREKPFFTPGFLDPLNHLYTNTYTDDPIMGFALYRRQVPNSTFPTVDDDIVQVSPLLEQIAYRYGVSPQFGTYGALIEDPFIAVAPAEEAFQSGSCFGVVPDMRGNYSYSDCSGNVTVTQVPAPGTIVWAGTHTITIIATDPLGNSTTTQTTFTVTPPTNPGPVPYEVYALDTQGVVAGAKYRYLLVRFGENGEAAQVIPVDEIEVESAL